MLWLIDGWLRNSFFTGEHRLLLPLFGVVVLALIQTIPLGKTEAPAILNNAILDWTISGDAFETLRFALKCLTLTIFLGLLIRYVSTEKRILILALVVVAIGLGSAIFGLVRSQMPQLFVALTSGALSSEESYGQFQNRNHFALLMEMSIGIALGVGFADLPFKARALSLLSGLVLLTALLLTHSRGGVLALLVGVPVFFLLFNFTRQSHSERVPNRIAFKTAPILVVVLTLVALVVSVALVGGDTTIQRIGRTPEEFALRRDGSPNLQRPQIWKATLSLIKDNPLMGVGFAAYGVGISRYLNNPGGWTPEEAHNEYLELIASGGVIGGILGVWLVFGFLKLAKSRFLAASLQCRSLICGALAGIVAVAVHSFFDFGLHITINSLICGGLIVLVVRTPGQARIERYNFSKVHAVS
jgi:O-antigen ligase